MSPRKKQPPRKDDENVIEYLSFRATRWIGSSTSLLVHTAIFVIAFSLRFFGVDFNTILLVLTTIVSLEAIYLSILIQMSVNKQDKQLREVSKDVGEIQQDVEDIQEDVEEIQEDIDEIQEDVDEIQEDVEEISEEEDETPSTAAHSGVSGETLERIESALKELGKEISEMKRQNDQR